MAEHRQSKADDDRRIASFRRWTIAGALAATAAFGGLAAAHTHEATASETDDSTSSFDSTASSSSDDRFTPSDSAPTQSFAPPAAQSGGS